MPVGVKIGEKRQRGEGAPEARWPKAELLGLTIKNASMYLSERGRRGKQRTLAVLWNTSTRSK